MKLEFIWKAGIHSLSLTKISCDLKLIEDQFIVPTLYHTILFWIYWLIAVAMGGVLVAALIRERDKGIQATAAMLLVPIILRILLIK